jgi:ribonuclease HI
MNLGSFLTRSFRTIAKIDTLVTKTKQARMSCLLQFDGGASPNPGPASGAYVLYSPPVKQEGSICRLVIQEGYKFIPHATNNEAEYTGLILGLEAALNYGITDIEIEGDSQLVVNQVPGAWHVKTPALVPYRSKAANLYFKFQKRQIRHIPRELNSDADHLTREALQTRQEIHRKSGSLVI